MNNRIADAPRHLLAAILTSDHAFGDRRIELARGVLDFLRASCM